MIKTSDGGPAGVRENRAPTLSFLLKRCYYNIITTRRATTGSANLLRPEFRFRDRVHFSRGPYLNSGAARELATFPAQDIKS